MPITIGGRTYGIGSLIALLVLVAAFVLFLIGGVTTLALLIMVGALALALLL